jgi:uncharacterized membrane protein YgdD (TMEM256/DUF423 family)
MAGGDEGLGVRVAHDIEATFPRPILHSFVWRNRMESTGSPDAGVGASVVWLAVSGVLGALGVALGAFGAHGLRSRLAAEALASWGTAVQYHLLHALALLALALFATATGRPVTAPAALFASGIVLFSGSIYALVLGGPRWLGPVTPLGGLALVAGWAAVAWMAWRGTG